MKPQRNQTITHQKYVNRKTILKTISKMLEQNLFNADKKLLGYFSNGNLQLVKVNIICGYDENPNELELCKEFDRNKKKVTKRNY